MDMLTDSDDTIGQVSELMNLWFVLVESTLSKPIAESPVAAISPPYGKNGSVPE